MIRDSGEGSGSGGRWRVWRKSGMWSGSVAEPSPLAQDQRLFGVGGCWWGWVRVGSAVGLGWALLVGGSG